MAIKAISQFDAATPTSNDKILFEQNGEGKSCSIGEAVNTCSLTYEEIMATNPVPDLSGKIASASVLKTLSDNLSGFSVLKSYHDYDEDYNIDDVSNYPGGLGLLNFTAFTGKSTGTTPFTDGHLLTFVWRNVGASNDILSQIAVEDDSFVMKIRIYKNGAWQGWKSVTIS